MVTWWPMDIAYHMKINPPSAKKTSAYKKLHLLIWAVLLSTIMSCFGGKLFDKSISGYGWIVPLLVACASLLKGPRGFKFPLMIWLPWISVVVIYQLFAEAENSFQRSIMLVTPLVIGVATSRLYLDEKGLQLFLNLCRFIAGALIMIVLYKTRLLFSGTLPFATGLAPEVITGSILCVIFASSYVLGSKKDVAWWASVAAIPVIAVTRMGMIASALSLPLTFAPMKIAKRFLFVALIAVFGLSFFYTDRVQQKMFYSGEGRIEDMKWDNPDFATSGRKLVWESMEAGIVDSPWFGHGANSSEGLVSSITGGLTHPHNDWLRLAYDYGYFGAVIFGISVTAQIIHALKKALSSMGNARILFYAGASSMIIFLLFMITDNIILYASFFGNLQFTVLGLAYGAYRQSASRVKSASHPRKLRITW